MDRSRRATGKQPAARPRPPTTSRLTVKARPNRRRPQGSIWSRLPAPAAVSDACGRALRRALPALTGVGIVCAIGGTAWAGYRFATTSPRFALATVALHGNSHATDEQLLAALPARPGDNVFAVDLDAVVAAVRANPWVASAEARRQLPRSLVIEVREHVPAALVQLGRLYLCDADGHPFKRAELGASDEGANLPIITGIPREAYVADPAAAAAQVRAALAALARWRAEPERPAIGELHLGSHGALTLVTYEHAISIQLGSPDESLGLRMQTFDATWAELTPGERERARAIHLDARPDHVTVALAHDKDS